MSVLTLFLCGDVMTGRGIDQILPHAVEPRLYEPWITDARDYVTLAEQVNGPIPRPVDLAYPWGDALDELATAAPHARIVNLETSVTTSARPWPGKGIHYHMHPGNVGLLRAAQIDCCVLANNHVLDWGREGLEDTLAVLHGAGIQTTGAGENARASQRPAILDTPAGRVLVYSCGHASSGIPEDWAATAQRSGVNLLADLSAATARRIGEHCRAVRRPGDRLVVSIHWGENWGYPIPAAQRAFAHALVDLAGADLVHGHSSHHVLGMEVYHGRLVLYGCGDLINDYEGIGGHAGYRGELSLLYFPRLRDDGALEALRMTPMRLRRMRLERADAEAVQWLQHTLTREGEGLGNRVVTLPDGGLGLRWS